MVRLGRPPLGGSSRRADALSVLALAAALFLVATQPASAGTDPLAGGGVRKLTEPYVTYRMAGVAYVHGSAGGYKETPLETAALGAGDRIRYLVVATNVGDDPQTAGVQIRIPDYTVWDPTADNGRADIVQWSVDGKHWRNGVPGATAGKRATMVRWTLAQKLEPGFSTAFVFQLRLTGPFSDRTHDLNMSRGPVPETVAALKEFQIELADQLAHVSTNAADPLGISELFGIKRNLVHHDGAVETPILTRNDVTYRVATTALVKNEHGAVKSVPLDEAQVHAGDRIRYVFSAQNVGSGPRQAGSTFNLPGYTQFEDATTADGLIDVSPDGITWKPAAQKGELQPRTVRWTLEGRLAPRQSARFTVMVTVARTPSAGELAAKAGRGAFAAVSVSQIQSVLFTEAVRSGKGHQYEGVPISDDLIRGVNTPSGHGFIASGAPTIAEHQPILGGKLGSDEHVEQIALIASIGAACLALTAGVLWLFWRVRQNRPAAAAAAVAGAEPAASANNN